MFNRTASRGGSHITTLRMKLKNDNEKMKELSDLAGKMKYEFEKKAK